ncbi:MAG TPA: aminotransferase class I/II-fold pyridoxal phosphate-dependent enzyme, partial [Roseimicrobium sp.]|nr:aminotransferase class I/II-fold pyridoxal phosphate-dependent enzyme [Roseimicrobium sp.]
RGTHFLVDDAHGAGVLGVNGRGTLEELGLSHKNTIRCLTLSKAFGVYGGAVLGEKKNIDRIRETSRMVSGNTPLPLPLAAAALKSIQLLKAHPEWRDRLVIRTRLVKAALRNAGYPQADTSVPIMAIHPGSPSKTDLLRKRLLRHGIFPSHIHYAGGPAEGYFRFALSSEHTTEQLRLLLRALRAD